MNGFAGTYWLSGLFRAAFASAVRSVVGSASDSSRSISSVMVLAMLRPLAPVFVRSLIMFACPPQSRDPVLFYLPCPSYEHLLAGPTEARQLHLYPPGQRRSTESFLNRRPN